MKNSQKELAQHCLADGMEKKTRYEEWEIKWSVPWFDMWWIIDMS
jgi:hypothetical protein